MVSRAPNSAPFTVEESFNDKSPFLWRRPQRAEHDVIRNAQKLLCYNFISKFCLNSVRRAWPRATPLCKYTKPHSTLSYPYPVLLVQMQKSINLVSRRVHAAPESQLPLSSIVHGHHLPLGRWPTNTTKITTLPPNDH
jgi:hypothetical protein